MSRYLLVIAVAHFACSSHVSERSKETAGLRSDLSEPGVARWVEGLVTGPGGEPLAGALYFTFSSSPPDTHANLGEPPASCLAM